MHGQRSTHLSTLRLKKFLEDLDKGLGGLRAGLEERRDEGLHAAELARAGGTGARSGQPRRERAMRGIGRRAQGRRGRDHHEAGDVRHAEGVAQVLAARELAVELAVELLEPRLRLAESLRVAPAVGGRVGITGGNG